MSDKQSLLAVFAHPDDESCGPGATLSKYAHRGVEVALLCMTRGEQGAWGPDQTIPIEEFGDVRVRELAGACTALGVQQWIVLGYPDGRVSQYRTEILVQDILLRVWRTRPQVMITHWPEGSDGHPDHDAVARAATTAFEQAGDVRFCKYVPDCPPYEPLKLYYADPPDPELAEKLGIRGAPTVLDVSNFAHAKATALLCHKSQEECWREQLAALQHTSRWKESFYLAGSRVPPAEVPEGDLFTSIAIAVTYTQQEEWRPT